MSECVVRMEMPECCDECPMEYDGFMCGAIHKRFYPKKDGCYLDPLIDPSKERLPDCPVICSLPEGHGRLVDADAYDYPGDLKWEPTIVPAAAERSET